MQKLQRNYMDYEDNNPFEASNPNMRAPVQPAAQGIFSGPFNLGQPYQATQPVQPAQPTQPLPTQNLVQQVIGQPTAPQFNFNGDPLYGSNPVGFDPNNLDLVADQAPAAQPAQSTSTIGSPLPGLNNYGLTPLNFDATKFNPDFFSANAMEDYFAKNPIKIDENAFKNTFGGFDLNGGLKLNSPAEQKRLNDLDAVVNPLVQQILGQGTTSKWSGGFGVDNSAKAMAKLLADAGITDIKQFGKVDKYEPVEVIGYSLNGNNVQRPNANLYYEQIPEYDSEGGVTYRRRDLTPEEIAQVKTQYGVIDTQTDEVKPVSKVVERDGKMFGVTGQTFGNKETGQEIVRGTGRWQRQGGDDLFSGTGEGDGNTGYRVQFGEDGTPYFYTTKGSSSDLGSIAPLLSIASLIPGVAPFAQGLNALIAAKQGNILGAISGAAGLGGLTNVANAANFAGALKSGNPLGIISSGANLGGVDLGGMVDASGVKDLTKVGNFDITDALKTIQTVKAIKSGDPASIISAVGGYLNKEPSAPTTGFANPDEFVSLPEVPTTSRLADRQTPGITEEVNPSDIPSIGGNPMDLLPKLPDLPKEPESFNSAFAKARASGEKTFEWNGKPYTTDLAPAKQPTYDSVGGGRGGQGGATAEELARYNAVRGNAPQSDIAKFVSSIFPSAEAGSLPTPKGPDLASQIPGYSPARSLAPGEKYNVPPSTYDQNNSIFGRVADELGLPQEFQRNVSNTLNALPGLNLPVGAIRGANALGRVAGSADELGASKYLDEAGRYIPGSNAYKAPEYASEATRMTADPMKMFKMIQDLPNDVYRTPAVQTALKAIANGDEVAAFKALESNPTARKELLKYAEKIGAQEVSPFKNIKLDNPAKYRQKIGGGFAGGGLASLTKKR